VIASDLETVLNSAFMAARKHRHQAVTVEHLLLYLLDSKPLVDHLEKHGIAVSRLRAALADAVVEPEETNGVEPQPTARFQQVIQAAVLRVKSKRRKEVSIFDVFGVLIDPNHSSEASELLAKNGAADSIARLRAHAV
jgi:ATP-dependent Clp protease ATP-binding subunit ClpA